MPLNWTKQALQGNLARSLRAGTRLHPQIDGHTFGFNDLKEMWCADDESHVVLTHDHDPLWQYWLHAPEGGWRPVSVHSTREQAKAAADSDAVVVSAELAVGKYVMARFEGGRWMRVQVLTRTGEAMLTNIFTGLGCQTKLETVQAA